MIQERSIEDIVEDFIELIRSGQKVSIESFATAFPGHSAELLELLPLAADMEKLNVSWNMENFPELPESDFKLLKKIGSGGMGTVYEAEQLSLQRRVAVKVLSPRLFDDEAQKAQFVNEARLIAQLHHPNIIKIIDAIYSGVFCCYVMELVEGTSLDRLHFSNIEDVVQIGIQTAQALDYAHSCGVLHRDVKPANLLLDERGYLHLGDFGLSVLRSRQEGSFPEIAGGTLRYMAPEQVTENKSSVQSDIYALGATLYELAFGKALFSGSTAAELKEEICKSLPEFPRNAPRGFAAVLKKCLHHDPEKRYRTAAEAAADLNRFLNNEAVSAENPSVFRRTCLWMRRNPIAAAWAAAAGVFLLTAFGALFIGMRETRKALEMTEFNARLADQTLEKIFARISALPSSHENNRLLAELLPYYQQLIRTGKLPEEKITSACRIIAQSAIRSGDYALAESSLRQIIKLRNESAAKNILATVLQKQGRREEADVLCRSVIAQCKNAATPQEKVEAVRAMLALSQPEKEEAFILLEELLAANPDVPEYRFQYALLLGVNPRMYRHKKVPGVEPNALVLLTELVQKFPDNREYSSELLKLALNKLRFARKFRSRYFGEINKTVDLSEKMLGRFPNDPELLTNVMALHTGFIALLRDRGEYIPARKRIERLLSVYEHLFYNPEVSDLAREKLIELQLKRVTELTPATGKVKLLEKISKELQLYHGSRLKEFQEKYAVLAGVQNH